MLQRHHDVERIVDIGYRAYYAAGAHTQLFRRPKGPRYIYNENLSTPAFEFSGATLSGTIVVGNDVPSPCTTCFVRVKQNRPASGNIQETLAIPID